MDERRGERENSSLDEEARPGSQGETDPGSEGDFNGAPMDEDQPSEAPDRRPDQTDEVGL